MPTALDASEAKDFEGDLGAGSDSSTASTGDGSDSEFSDDEEVEPKFSIDETILIFDWDDTVLPSTWIQEQGLRLDEGSTLTDQQRSELDIIASKAVQMLTVAKRHGTVVLVTNAETGWIELSAQKFLPCLWPLLQDNVRILSARSTFEAKGVQSPFEWKFLAFGQEIQSHYSRAMPGERRNVLSFGDSAHEREALIRVAQQIPNCRTKSLKFVERPGIEQLSREHTLVTDCFKEIVNHDGNLDLCIRCQ